MNKGSILLIAALSEAALLLLSYGITFVSGGSLYWNPTLPSILVGLALALPLLVGNAALWRWTHHHPDSIYAKFSREVVVPLCRQVPPFHAFLIGLLSGVGEEALFRGALNHFVTLWAGQFLSLIITSFAFASIHFVGSFKRYGRMIPLYSLVGGLLWCEHLTTDSLSAVAATHGFYNFCAIVWIRQMSKKQEQMRQAFTS